MKFRFLVLAALLLAFRLAAQTTFWDAPETVAFKGAGFPTTVQNTSFAAAFWQVKTGVDAGWPQYYLALTTRSLSDASWSAPRNVLGPFTLTGGDSQFYSAVLTKSGDIWLAVLEKEGQVSLYRSSDQGQSFALQNSLTSPRTNTLLVPKLFLGVDDEPLLFVNEAEETSIRIASSRHSGGVWSPLKTVTADSPLNSYQPSLAVRGKTLTLLYQSPNGRNNYQIYRRDSLDGGATWGQAVLLSDFDPTVNPDLYDNQRPNGLWWNDNLYVVWERKTSGTQTLIQWIVFDAAGKMVPGSPREVTTNDYSARNPQLFLSQGVLNLGWFDNANKAYNQNLATWNPSQQTFSVKQLSNDVGNSYLGQSVSLGGELYYFWQYVFGTGASATSQIVLLKPDRTADAPTLRPMNFLDGKPSNNADFRVQALYPRDISGISGLAWTLSREPDAIPDKKITVSGKDPTFTVHVPAEGDWYLSAAVRDLAGNWSAPAVQKFLLDVTPPGPVLFDLPAVDAEGFLSSNTFTLSWKTTTSDGVSYSWRLDRIGEFSVPATLKTLKLAGAPSLPTGSDAAFSRTNLENGVWALTVSAFDEAGNQGGSSSYFFRLNKFKPFTLINSVVVTEDDFQRFQLEIRGVGFLSDGKVDKVVLDRDGRAPWDVELIPQTISDRTITVRAADLAQGVYKIGVVHSARGVLFAVKTLQVGPGGTVKIGDFRNLDQTVWEFFQGITVYFSVNTAFFWTLFVFLVASIVVSAWQVRRLLAQMRRVDHQAEDLFTDMYSRRAALARRVSMKRKGLSLTFKFAASILSLTLAIILMLALVLGFLITENSRTSLGNALQQRAEVLLEGLVSGARTALRAPESSLSELLLLPSQINSMRRDPQHQDADYATIQGGANTELKKPGYSFLWSTNDPDYLKKINTAVISRGESTWKTPDEVEKAYLQLQKTLNETARARLGEVLTKLDGVNKQIVGYSGSTNDAKYKDLVASQKDLKDQIATELADVGKDSYTYPKYDTATLLGGTTTRYLFYKPVLFYTEGDNENFVKGLVRLQVSTESIVRDITDTQRNLVVTTLVIALVALALGLIGAFVLSTITINPIRKLVKGVEVIRDTEDKRALANHVIDVRSKDELADLAKAINQMTEGLVHAAIADEDLKAGKDIQKTFVPLDRDAKGRKMTTGYLDLPDAEIFGYYEGAKGVSGDYYDFRQLDNKDGENPQSPWYGFIKCDVSGKGIVGALIMFTVASVVVNFFRNWSAAKDSRDIQLTGLVANVNDLLETLKFPGRFAALNTGILNVKTGRVRLCHAGDKFVHVWRGESQTFQTIELPSAPATGQIADMFARSLYKHYDLDLKSGDTLFFYTDGIEEDKRYFRDADYNLIAFFDPSDASTITTPGNRRIVTDSQGKEIEMTAIDNEPLHEPATPAQAPTPRNPEGTPADEGNERIDVILQAFYSRGTYRLVRKHTANPNESLTFDFSTCTGTAREAITALISIDRVFRLVPDPKCTADDRIKLDVIQNEFLKKHFLEYNQYFHAGVADTTNAEYIWFDHLKEDDQFDDLTLLAIRKK